MWLPWLGATYKKGKTAETPRVISRLTVPLSVLFSNQFLKDLDKIWELREWIPDPTKPILPPNKRIKHTA